MPVAICNLKRSEALGQHHTPPVLGNSLMMDLPRLERFGPLRLAGLRRHHRLPRDLQDMSRDITKQWHEFLARGVGTTPSDFVYGVCLRMEDGTTSFDYFCGTPIVGELPAGLTMQELPAMHCAVFQHRQHVSSLRDSMHMILGTALPRAGLEAAEGDAPEFIERYGKSFDPNTGFGGFEVLVPLKA